jgi:hypothetical protein
MDKGGSDSADATESVGTPRRLRAESTVDAQSQDVPPDDEFETITVEA